MKRANGVAFMFASALVLIAGSSNAFDQGSKPSHKAAAPYRIAQAEQEKDQPPSGEIQERGVPMLPQQGMRQITPIRVTANEIARLPGTTPYLVDLTRPGAMYEFDPSVGPIDYSRVIIRTGKGDTAIGTLMNGPLRSRITAQWSSTRFRMSHPGGSRTFLGPKSITNFTCQGLECTCTGDPDCNDMFGSGVCGDIAVCNENGCSCLRL
jgi:hypothetical protein